MLGVVERAGATDVGRQRHTNEDSLVIAPPFFAVADGMGGAKAGEVASRLAVEAFTEAQGSDESPEAQLVRILRDANKRIYELAVSDDSRRGMGTTLTAVKVHGHDVSIGHVGDSRAYRLREGELEQLTKDHSLVAELERTGQITAEAAEHHPQRSIITRALGPEPDVEVDTYTVAGRAGDVYLLCSDGLTGMVSDGEMASILRGADSLEAAAGVLVKAANQSGGKDNITVVLFRLGDAGEAAQDGDTDEQTIAGGLTAEDVQAAADSRDPAPGEKRPDTVFRSTISEPLPPAEREPPAEPGRESPLKPRRRRRGRALLKALVALLVVAGVVAGLYALTREAYFVGTNDAGLVTLYRGVPYELPFGLELYAEEYASGVPARAVPRARRPRILDHELRSREDATDLVRQLERGSLDAGPER